MSLFKALFQSRESMMEELKSIQEPQLDLIAEEMYHKFFSHLKEGADKKIILQLLKMTMYKAGIVLFNSKNSLR